MAEGRDFQQDFGADSLTKFIINEKAVQALGLTSAVNQQIVWYDDDGTFHGEIIGVIEDFHYKSLHQTIQPLVLMVKPSEYNYLLVRINPARISGIINEIKLEWGKFDDMFTFEYSFLADEFDAQYRNEERMGRIYWIMAMLAVIIAMMGLFGLSTFTLEQKIQEIGVRKVHGATSMSVLRMFYFDFSKWVLLAFIIAAPLGYWGMKYWLRDFSYQKDPALWIFLAAGLVTEFIAILAVSYQAIRASAMKPVDSLRYE